MVYAELVIGILGLLVLIVGLVGAGFWRLLNVLSDFKGSSSEMSLSAKNINETMKEVTKQLKDHEVRISVLERQRQDRQRNEQTRP